MDYDPAQLSYSALLDSYFSYTGGVQFPRVKSTGAQRNPRTVPPLAASARFRLKRQYAPVVFTHDDIQRAAAESALASVRQRYGDDVVTLVEDLYQDSGTSFWDAEPYHQKWKLQKRRELMLALALPDEDGLLSGAATTLNAFAGGAIDAAMTRQRLQSLVDQGELDVDVFEAVTLELESSLATAPGAWKR